jgi:eukaryotic-like serine/threonine-protein kinase
MAGEIVAIAFLSLPVWIVGIRTYYRALEKGLVGPKAKQLEQSPEQKKELEDLRNEKKQLEARVQNLESIVCSVDLELNARLNRLAVDQNRSSASNVAPQLPSGGAHTLALSPGAPVAPPVNNTPGELQVGQVLASRYKIERQLGRGGMGSVYLARDSQLNEPVALKIINSALLSNPIIAAERFRREASTARKITHPNVIRIHDIGEENGLFFLSMEFFDGMMLSELLSRRGALPIDEAKDIFRQIAEGLSAAHAMGIVHRDIKPQNVLYNPQKVCKLIDFGLAKASFLSDMTATGFIIGTPDYMAPEQVRGKPIDVRTDVYAFGCLAYHVLTGAPPFRGDSPISVGFMHCSQVPEPPIQKRADIPATMSDAILKALAKEPSSRFNAIDELKQALLR